jgi:glucosamine--fructose-6-phosphate aminotransferase (isomerizing)
MCGIAGFISNQAWLEKPDLSWLEGISRDLETWWSSSQPPEDLSRPLKELVDRFDDLMSFGLHAELADNPDVLEKMENVASLLEQAESRIVSYMAEKGRTDALEQISEDTRDCLWQINEEVVGNVRRTSRLIPEKFLSQPLSRGHRFVAWAVEGVMENLDRLEVRGRDSAGISIQCYVPADPQAARQGSSVTLPPEIPETLTGGVKSVGSVATCSDGHKTYTFVYKVANLVGRLGENTGGLRKAIQRDRLLWTVAGLTRQINIIAHTRWASNGIISLSNCHPANGALVGREHEPTVNDHDAAFVLNGDVDNYLTLSEVVLRGQGFDIDPLITTDAKILPVFYRLGTDPSTSPQNRFATLMNSCDGSLAIVMQHPHFPGSLHLGQKGSGQSLFVGLIKDGLILASEVYGLASRTRRSYALSGTERGGTQVTVTVGNSEKPLLVGRFLEDGGPFEMNAEPIYIHSRDIYRGAYNYYFEKEIHEAPSSVRKTIKGKYRKLAGKIDFNVEGYGTLAGLVSRLRDPNLPAIRRIMAIGQGTASVAAMGVAHLVEKALSRTRFNVGWCKASEMSGFLSDESLSDMLVIAISQSGTTTDTNRTVDLAGAQGAWIHAIVNRRNSPLVTKSNSHFYTGDGRDVEMAVASTKAFYSQIAAGKLISLLLAQEFGTLTDEEIYQEIHELERLPADIEWVLNQDHILKECAEKYGPSSRNWAVVGNGPNKIAADEIRIKLSELCYKSIPCDFTEDKKHIDLSTEPLTLVVANDLPDQIVQDTAKEVSIFKAHNGKPLVFCARGEKRFRGAAEKLIELPVIGGGLGFVLATVAGHLWGFYAAKAIDAGAEEFRKARTMLTRMLEDQDAWNPGLVRAQLMDLMKLVAAGEMNAALPASSVAAIATYIAELEPELAPGEFAREKIEEGIVILSKAAEEMTRPIDTIRHQAKTVTVGISRPQELLPPMLMAAFDHLEVFPSQIRELDRRMLRATSPIISEVTGGMLYKMLRMTAGPLGDLPGQVPRIQVAARFGQCEGKASRYDEPRVAGGSKRTVLRMERAIWSSGASGEENLVLVPLFNEENDSGVGISLLHVVFVSECSVEQKLAVLRCLGNRYHDIIERIEEVSQGASLEDALEKISPRDLMLTPVDRLLFPKRQIDE